MKLADLFRLHTCFHEATHAACLSIEGVANYPVAQVSRWSEEHLQAASDLATRLAVVARESGEPALRDELLAVVAKAGQAVKHAAEQKRVDAADRRAEKKAGTLPGLQGDPD